MRLLSKHHQCSHLPQSQILAKALQINLPIMLQRGAKYECKFVVAIIHNMAKEIAILTTYVQWQVSLRLQRFSSYPAQLFL